MYTIELMDNKSEIIRYNVPHMPIKVSASRQEDYPSLSVVNHWHNDLNLFTSAAELCGTALTENPALLRRDR